MSRRADDSEPPIKFVKAGRASRAGQAGHLLADEPSQNHGADLDIPVEADEGILAAVSPEHQSIAKHRYLNDPTQRDRKALLTSDKQDSTIGYVKRAVVDRHE